MGYFLLISYVVLIAVSYGGAKFVLKKMDLL